MGKTLDKIIFSLAVIFIIFSWGLYATKSYLVAFIITFVGYTAVSILFALLVSRKKRFSGISPQEMANSLALLGHNETAKIFYNTLPDSLKVKLEPPFFVSLEHGKETLTMANYKFSGTTADEVARAYRKCKDENLENIKILSRGTEKRVLLIASNLDINITFPDLRTIKRYLHCKNALPEKLVSHGKKKRVRPDFKALAETALSRGRIKYYILTGTMLFLMSFLTPLKLYYMIMATIPLALAGISAVFAIKNDA
ncbi:MAG: hypothetical protein FWD49_05980 [Firmicutes bacterium]|nr:hypothetical protein [Bacillota bacterium]